MKIRNRRSGTALIEFAAALILLSGIRSRIWNSGFSRPELIRWRINVRRVSSARKNEANMKPTFAPET